MSTGTGNAAEHVNAQFTLTNVWHRLGRAASRAFGRSSRSGARPTTSSSGPGSA